eukprot:gene9834-18410_t
MSGKRFELLDVPDHFDRCQTDREIDWNLCFLCQGVDQTALVCPANVTRADASQGYLAVIENLRRFEEIGQLPSSLKRRENSVVCPPSIQNGMLTSAAIDNIDHNPSSSTALSAFHGTSISIFQHPKIMRGQTQLQLENDIEKSSVPLELPSYYTEICPTKSKIPEYPLQRTNTEDYSNNAQKLLEDNGWLQNLHCWER